MKTLKLASLAAFALPLFASIGAPAQAGTHEFLPAVGCVGTTTEGEVAGTVWFQSGFAVNNHSSEDRDIMCPIRYVRLNPVATPVIVRAVVKDWSNDPGGKVLAWICQTDVDVGASCVDVDTTTDAYRGSSTLEVSMTPNADTRFLYLLVRLPDADGDGHKSYFAGYRVCRNEC